MDPRAAVTAYGYPALAGGVLMEGETPLIVGGALAQHGMLLLGGVVAIGAAVAWVTDQSLYWIGRRGGRAWLLKRPRWEAAADRAGGWIERRPNLAVAGFRFVYGARSVTAFLVGARGFPPVRYMAITAISAVAWSSAWAGAGYVFGEAAERWLGQALQMAGWAVPMGIGLVCIAVFVLLRIRRSVLI